MILTPRKREHIMPLPVVLISTLSGDGVKNAAPWSNITPILRPFSDIVLGSWVKRDTLNIIRATKEFVINVPTADMVEAVMVCSRNYPPEVDEFERAGLRARPSRNVKPPGIEGCLAWAECTLVEEISRKNYSLVVGTVVHLEVDDDFFNEAGEMDYERARPLSVMLGDKGMYFTRPVFAGRYAEYAEMFLSQENSTDKE
ncbi:flavin reductase family protein [Desulfoscipio sp. XC116]|uniref:flavin reductase family protein n=1 Tax=Desulfoscipio sp. XC116 TaxID=3144975 RepID=UPI00325AA478